MNVFVVLRLFPFFLLFQWDVRSMSHVRFHTWMQGRSLWSLPVVTPLTGNQWGCSSGTVLSVYCTADWLSERSPPSVRQGKVFVVSLQFHQWPSLILVRVTKTPRSLWSRITDHHCKYNSSTEVRVEVQSPIILSLDVHTVKTHLYFQCFHLLLKNNGFLLTGNDGQVGRLKHAETRTVKKKNSWVKTHHKHTRTHTSFQTHFPNFNIWKNKIWKKG